MSRRAQRPELEFGSDSFLDVVCNIVGILIILIVVVGVKVERKPQVSEIAANSVTASAIRMADQESLIRQHQQMLNELKLSEEEIARLTLTLKEKDETTQRQIQETIEAQEMTKQQLAARQEKSDLLKKQISELESDRDAIAARVAILQKTIDEKSRDALKLGQVLATVMTTEEEMDDKLQTTAAETQRLQEVLEETQKAAIPTDRLQHRLSPVTKTVEKGELHFRVSNGRISEIPLEDLLERLKEQVLSRRSTVMRFNQFEGTVGPVRGYTMTYTVEKEGPSTLEAIQNGDGRTRVNVSRWKIDPDPSLVDESFAQAIRPGSRYRQVIETAMPDTVVTMWIYPDSFGGFGPLREVAHGLQLRVAARPLPIGTPIVGSPGGSKSTAQ